MATDTSPIELFQPEPALGVPNPSPACVKLEAWLRLTGIEYRVVPSPDPRKGPKKKVPWIKDGDMLIGDSMFIIDHLKATRGVDPDAGESARDAAIALALTRQIEEHLYWIMVYSRWIDPVGWPIVKPLFFSILPPVIRTIVPAMLRGKLRTMLKAQGLMRHSHDEIYAIGGRDLAAISDLLGEASYFGGAEPTTVDCTA